MGFSFDDGRTSTFGRELMNYISSKLPYAGYDLSKVTDTLNPKYKYFETTGVRRTEALSRHSISQNFDYNNAAIGDISSNKQYSDIMYANIQKDKGARVRDYRIIAAFAEVADALDEICDEVINRDANGQVIKLQFKNIGLTDLQQETLNKEFSKYIQHFELETRGWDYFRQLLIEGEIYFEHIIHEKYPKEGILGVVQVPTELIDPVFSNIQNVMVKGYLYRKPKFDPKNPTKQVGVDYVPLDKNQITYIHSNIWNENRTMRLPFIENARRAYRQLSMIEDSIVIYRLVRAPERLVFNVDVGNMAAPKAEAYLRKLQTQYWSSKTFDSNQSGIVQKFNPQSMLDSFWFAKRAGSEGTNVTTLPGGCLSMDTKVPLLDGRSLTISEIESELKQQKQIWVYSTDPKTGRIAPGLVSWAGVTQKSAEVMRLTFDNGKEVVCTLDHKFPIIGKGFVEAKDLEIGESMIPHYTKTGKLGGGDYEMIHQNDTKTWEFTHRMVGKFFKTRNEHNVAHHKDHNKLNNSPDNLVYMNGKDHIIYHRDQGFAPMVGTLASKKRLEKMKLEDPEAYAQLCKDQQVKTTKMWAEFTNKERKLIKKKIKAGIKKYISGLTPEEREQRAKISRANRKKGIEQLLKMHESDPQFKEQHYSKVSASIKSFFKSMDEEQYASFINQRTSRILSNSDYQQSHIKHSATQSLEFDKVILDFVLDCVRSKTTHQVTKHDVAAAINNNSTILNHYLEINKNKQVKNWCGTKFAHTHLSSLVKKFGYQSWTHFRKESDHFNHKLVKIERLPDHIEVGTLTIDSEEKYHNYHTFALDCGVYTKNSNLGQLEDLFYFMKKLYKSLKVPVTRLDANDAFRDGQDLLREELKFARFIIRLQQHVAGGLKNGFITHLQLRGLWEDLKLKEHNIDLEFNVPTNFYELRESQKLELKISNFNNMAANEYVSPTFAQKKYLGWTDVDIKANREFLRKDKALRWELSQIENAGPDWKEAAATQAGALGGTEGGATVGGGGGGGMPPPFAGGPAATPEAGEAEAPPEGEAAPAAGATPAPEATPPAA